MRGDKAGAGSFSGCHAGATTDSMEVRCRIGISRSINQFYSLEIISGFFNDRNEVYMKLYMYVRT